MPLECFIVHGSKCPYMVCRYASEHIYGFSEFTCSLKKPEPSVCPTDSRLRPDQCIMENDDFDNANVEKVCIRMSL